MTTDALITAIQRRLTNISEQQHALAVEKARLVEQLTPLRLGIVAPAMVVAQLKAKGVKLRRWPPAPSADRRPRPATLKAVASIVLRFYLLRWPALSRPERRRRHGKPLNARTRMPPCDIATMGRHGWHVPTSRPDH